MCVRVEMDEVATGVKPDAALAWWSDFREGNRDHHGMPGQTRRILAESGDRVTMEDVVQQGPLRVFREITTAEVLPDRVRFEGRNTVSRFRGTYVFHDHPEGTRVRLKADIQLRPPLNLVDRVAAPIARAVLKRDLALHVREMRRDLL